MFRPPSYPEPRTPVPDPACLHALGEHFIAGFFELPRASRLRRWARAVRRRWEHQTVPAYRGQALYPSGPARPNPGENRIVAPCYSFTWAWRPEVLEQTLDAVADPEQRQALAALRQAMTREENARSVAHSPGHAVGGWGYTHSIPNYGRVFREGLDQYEQRIHRRIKSVNSGAAENRSDFYSAMLEVLAGIRTWHARLLKELERTPMPDQAGEQNRLRLIQALHRVPFQPARNFFEALETWNLVYFLDDCDNPGRMDLELGALFERDLDGGECTWDQAVEWLAGFADTVTDNQGWSAAIGGIRPDGRPNWNRMTELCLTVARGRPRPSWELRVRPEMPDRLWNLALDAVATGSGNPAFYNDPLYLDALREAQLGLDPAALSLWNGGGCTETMVHGCSNVGSLDAGLNLAEVFEKTLHRELRNSADFAAFIEAFFSATQAAVRRVADAVNQIQEKRARYAPQPMRSLLIDDCLERGCDFTAGGARYNWSVVNVAGISNVVDSLAAVREAVFRKKTVGAGELLEALAANFEGRETLRRNLMRCPRFGNDIPEVDGLAAQVAERVFRGFRELQPWRGGRFLPSCIMFETYAAAGRYVGATPDGRRAGEPLADSIGPVAGRDRRGPTAMLRSVTRLPLRLAAGTPVLNIRLAKSLFRTPAGRARVRRLIETYFRLGGMQIQVTVTDRETLLDALEHPERHEDLIVRIGGYSTWFNRLSRELKLTVIERTEYE